MEVNSMEYLILNIALWFGLYAIVALSLNIEYGYGGIPNFGRALAVLIGGITVGGIINRILMHLLGITGGIIEASGKIKSIVNELIAQDPALGILIFLASLILAAILGGIAGAVFIIPSAKLSEDYLAITLLAISEVIFLTLYYNVDFIGGYYGVSIPDFLAFMPGKQRIFIFTLLTLLIAFGCYLFAEKLLNSPYGRALRSMRENEIVAKAYGKDVMALRIKTVAIGSSIASLAGALYSLYSVNVITTSFSRVEWTFYPILMVLLGGAGNNTGVLLGVFTFVAIKILLITYKFEITSALKLPFEAVWLEYILFGVVMLLILIYRPEGLLKEKPILTKPIKRIAKARVIKQTKQENILSMYK
jgi:branched-chain amino acid transport system permease protein